MGARVGPDPLRESHMVPYIASDERNESFGINGGEHCL